jgi:hypothetical protein
MLALRRDGRTVHLPMEIIGRIHTCSHFFGSLYGFIHVSKTTVNIEQQTDLLRSSCNEIRSTVDK